MGIKEIVDIFEKYGIGSGILIVMSYIAWMIVKSNTFKSLLGKIGLSILSNITSIKKSNVREITEKDIINHDIFNYIDFWMYSKVPTFKFSTEYRTLIFRKYLTIYLKKHKENLKNYISNETFKSMSDSELWTSLLKLINDTIFDYEKEMNSIGIPDIIIEKMKVKNNDTISLTIDLIEGICNSQFYNSENNFLKIYSILNIMLSILENAISNSNKICDSINGQLKDMEFGGKKEP